METFSALLAICVNGSVNNHEAGDLRRYRAHYDVIVMFAFDMLYQIFVICGRDISRVIV